MYICVVIICTIIICLVYFPRSDVLVCVDVHVNKIGTSKVGIFIHLSIKNLFQ